jgi:hypothetical protein
VFVECGKYKKSLSNSPPTHVRRMLDPPDFAFPQGERNSKSLFFQRERVMPKKISLSTSPPLEKAGTSYLPLWKRGIKGDFPSEFSPFHEREYPEGGRDFLILEGKGFVFPSQRKSSSVLLRHSPDFVFQRRRVNGISLFLRERAIQSLS